MSNSRFNFFNKSLALLLSTVIFGSTSFQTVHCSNVKSSDTVKVSEKDDKSNALSEVGEWLKRHWLISGLTSGVTSGIIWSKFLKLGLSIVCLSAIVKHDETKLVDVLNQKFYMTPNKFTKKQEGLAWCWLACLQGLYRYNDIEISQEDIYKAIFHENPSRFNVTRGEYLPMGPWSKSFFNSINSLNDNVKLNKATIYYRDVYDLESIENCIKDYYNSIGERAFSIIDNVFSGIRVENTFVLHFVNVVNITDGNITIEDPQTGLSRTESLKEFCERYSFGMMSVSPIIQMMSLVDVDSKMTSEINYFCREGVDRKGDYKEGIDKKIGSFSKICY